MANVRDLHMEEGSPGASPRLKPQRAADPGHLETSRKRSERSVQTRARVLPTVRPRVVGSRGALTCQRPAADAHLCGSAKAPSCGQPGETRYLFRGLPRTAGRHTHQTASPVAETFPPELPSCFWLAPGSPELGQCRPFPPLPLHTHRPGPPAGRPLTRRWARGPRTPLTRGLCLRRGARGGRPERAASLLGRARGWAGGRAGSGSGSRAPRRSRARGLAVERRAPRRPRGLQAASAAPPGQGKGDARRGSGGAGGPSRCPAREGSHPDPKYSVPLTPAVRGSRAPSVSGTGGVRGARPPDPRRPPPTVVTPTPRQGLARRPGGAGKSRPPPSTSLVRHWGSRARAPRTPRAPRSAALAPRPLARPRPGPALRPGRARRPGWGLGEGAVAVGSRPSRGSRT